MNNENYELTFGHKDTARQVLSVMGCKIKDISVVANPYGKGWAIKVILSEPMIKIDNTIPVVVEVDMTPVLP